MNTDRAIVLGVMVTRLVAESDDDFYCDAEAVLGIDNTALAAYRDAHPALRVHDSIRSIEASMLRAAQKMGMTLDQYQAYLIETS